MENEKTKIDEGKFYPPNLYNQCHTPGSVRTKRAFQKSNGHFISHSSTYNLMKVNRLDQFKQLADKINIPKPSLYILLEHITFKLIGV